MPFNNKDFLGDTTVALQDAEEIYVSDFGALLQEKGDVTEVKKKMSAADFHVKAEHFTQKAKSIAEIQKSECRSIRRMATQRGAKVQPE